MSVGRIRRRLAAAVAAGRAASAKAGAAPAVRPGPEPSGRRESWALVHLGPDQAFPAALDALLEVCAGRRLRPLVLSDRFPRPLLGRPAIVFEHLPLAAEPACGVGPADIELVTDYACRRLALALDFWRVAGVTWSGDAAEALREACAGSLRVKLP